MHWQAQINDTDYCCGQLRLFVLIAVSRNVVHGECATLHEFDAVFVEFFLKILLSVSTASSTTIYELHAASAVDSLICWFLT